MLKNLNYKYYEPSRITIGCEPLGGVDWGNYDIDDVKKAISSAIDMGVTSFDIADVYGLGQGEKELAKALGSDRHKAFITTKFGVRWCNNSKDKRSRTYKDCSPKYLKEALENSLRRLRIDAIPLYLVHWPDKKASILRVLELLEIQKKEGKILNYGISNFAIDELENITKNSKLSSIQDSFNLLDHDMQMPLFAKAKSLNLTTFSYGTLAQGLLTNKFNIYSKFPKNDRRSRLKIFKEDRWKYNSEMLDKLIKISKKYGHTITSTSIRWVLDSGFVDSAIVGIKSKKQLKENIQSLNWKLEKNDVNFLANQKIL